MLMTSQSLTGQWLGLRSPTSSVAERRKDPPRTGGVASSQVSHGFLASAHEDAGRVSTAAPNIPIRRRSLRVNVIRHLLCPGVGARPAGIPARQFVSMTWTSLGDVQIELDTARYLLL